MHVDKDIQEELWSPTGHFYWTNDHSFEDRILPAYKDHWDDVINELKDYDIVTFTTYFSNLDLSSTSSTLPDNIGDEIIKFSGR